MNYIEKKKDVQMLSLKKKHIRLVYQWETGFILLSRYASVIQEPSQTAKFDLNSYSDTSAQHDDHNVMTTNHWC